MTCYAVSRGTRGEKIDTPEEGDENTEKKAPRRRTTKARVAKAEEAAE